MIQRLQNVVNSRKDGDKGFSLVELAVVIVIIGILAAIAVPIFANMQGTARQNSVAAAAANGAAIVASNIAAEKPAYDGVESAGDGTGTGETAKGNIFVKQFAGSGSDLNNFCVEATGWSHTVYSPKGCNS